jgi:hypothetical protein
MMALDSLAQEVGIYMRRDEYRHEIAAEDTYDYIKSFMHGWKQVTSFNMIHQNDKHLKLYARLSVLADYGHIMVEPI